MIRLFATVLATVVIAPGFCFAADEVPAKHSTVSIVFINPQSPRTMGGMNTGGMGTGGMGSAGMGGSLADSKPMTRVGSVFVPTDSLRPIRITIDGDFVGHALVGMVDINPVFILPQGLRKFTFTVEGFDPVATELTVLGTGSKQFLLVKLPSNPEPAKAAASNIDDSSVKPVDK